MVHPGLKLHDPNEFWSMAMIGHSRFFFFFFFSRKKKKRFMLRLFFLYKFVSIKYKTTIKIEMIDVEIGKSEGISLWQP